MQNVEVQQRVSLARDAVFDLLADLPGWTQWAGLGTVTLEREGETSRCGPGAIRVFTSYGITGAREEILSLERPETMTYTLLSGMPIRNHQGEMRCTVDGNGTLVTWRCRFDSRLPGLGPIFQRLITLIFTRAMKRFARYAASRPSS